MNEQMREEHLVLKNFSDSELMPLTASEKEAVRRMWGAELSFEELGLFKKHRDFDPRYMSHYFYLPIIAHKLNDYHYTWIFEHKSLQGYIVKGYLKSPYCYVRCVEKEYYDNDMNQLSRKQAIDACLQHDTLIVKDSVDSSGGQSVEKLVLAESKNQRQEIEKVLNERKRDFVIQECINQHPSMAKFNDSSINTLRVTTLYLNGKYSTLSVSTQLLFRLHYIY